MQIDDVIYNNHFQRKESVNYEKTSNIMVLAPKDLIGSPFKNVKCFGDQIRVTSEGCDDLNSTDGIGCLADCSGALPGYNCSGGN